jgi:hypothetical protein
MSGGVWSKKMAPLVSTASRSSLVPYKTLKLHLMKWMAQELSPTDEKSKSKSRADARGVLKAIEMKQLYDWTEFMRQRYTPATRLTLRSQVREVATRMNV